MGSLPAISLVGIVDIIAVATLIYLLLLLIRGTRGLYMLTGLLILLLVFWLSRLFELSTLDWILGQLFSSLVLIIVVIFQHDIRRLLTKVGRSTLFSPVAFQQQETFEELIKTAVSLANKKIGALIVVEREGRVSDHVEQGVLLDAQISKELLTSIFLPVSPLHDGAVLIQGARVTMASTLLPLSMSADASESFGTRHRAALGLVEETDAVVIVISEERGSISLALDGVLEHNLDAKMLRQRFREIFGPTKLHILSKSLDEVVEKDKSDATTVEKSPSA